MIVRGIWSKTAEFVYFEIVINAVPPNNHFR